MGCHRRSTSSAPQAYIMSYHITSRKSHHNASHTSHHSQSHHITSPSSHYYLTVITVSCRLIGMSYCHHIGHHVSLHHHHRHANQERQERRILLTIESKISTHSEAPAEAAQCNAVLKKLHQKQRRWKLSNIRQNCTVQW